MHPFAIQEGMHKRLCHLIQKGDQWVCLGTHLLTKGHIMALKLVGVKQA